MHEQYPYFHVECNSAGGYCDKVGTAGSPVVFTRKALEVARPFHAFFCDIDPEALARLRAAIEGITEFSTVGRFTYCPGDNAEWLPRISAMIAQEDNPARAFGTCVIDPNGYPYGYPVLALPGFLGRHPRIDPIINLNCSLFSRVDGCKASRHEAIRKGFANWPELGEVILSLPRPAESWWISNPPHRMKADGEQFLTFWSRAIPGRKRFKEFVPLMSHAGQVILKTKRHDWGGWLPGMEDVT
jgi:hypothetical protein